MAQVQSRAIMFAKKEFHENLTLDLKITHGGRCESLIIFCFSLFKTTVSCVPQCPVKSLERLTVILLCHQKESAAGMES